MNNKIVLGLSKSEKTLILLFLMILGGLLGWFLPVIADWLLKLPIVPGEKFIEYIASMKGSWFSILASIIGVFLGLLLTLITLDESLEVTIDFETIQFKLGEKVRIIHKNIISAIYLENKQLVILGERSKQLYREVLDAKKETVQNAVNQYRYPWYDKDPFEGQYQRWVLGHPDFSEKINALLYAREQALKEGKKKDAKYLQEDLAELGVVIRDDKNGQYARIVKMDD